MPKFLWPTVLFVVMLVFSFVFPGISHAAEARSSAIERNPAGYDIPELVRSKFLGWVRRDLSRRIPGEETLIKQYFDEWNFRFETLTINRIIFAYNIDVDGKYPYDLTLIDTNCDGLFDMKVEEKNGERVETAIPECVFGPASTKAR